jgi:DNA mismatch repair protein MSH6
VLPLTKCIVQLKLDKELVTAGNFHTYDPLRQSGTLVLDGQTLQNLDVFENSGSGGSDGTLFKLLNNCVTPSGKFNNVIFSRLLSNIQLV